MDQAIGLRMAVERQPMRSFRMRVPQVHAHFLLGRDAPVRIPACALVWHWRPAESARTGWDLQSRLHVVGHPRQFSEMQRNQWRTLFSQWHLCGHTLDIMLLADVGWIWLSPGQELRERLRPIFHWLCRNRPHLPIILAGLGEANLQRVQQWASTRFPLQFWNPETVHSGAEQKQEGYYRILRLCDAPNHISIVKEVL